MKRGIKNLFIVLIIANIFICFKSLTGQDVTIVHSDGSVRARLKTTELKPGIRYIAINEFASLFNTTTYYDSHNKKYVLKLENINIKLSAFNPFIAFNSNIYQLPVEPIFSSSEIYVPMSFFLEAVSAQFPKSLSYNRVTDVLKILTPIYGKTFNIKNIDIEEKVNGTLIKITTIRDFSQADLSLRARHSWLYLDIYGGRVDSVAFYKEYKTGIVARIVPSQISNELAQIGFRMRDEIIEKQLILQSPRKIFVTVKTQRDLSHEVIQNIEREKRKWLIDKIVIDPGHGGRDPGTIGYSGSHEKNIVLPISKYLKNYIENELNIEVLMTRESDRFVELKHRTEFANQNEAKLFISIHANFNYSRGLRGVSTYFLGPDKSDEATEVAEMENSVIKYESESKYSDLTWEQHILSAGAQSLYNKESEDLAGLIQEAMINECNLQDRGVRQAGFYVLWGASMPAVLIETAFISNPKDEKLLKSKSFQKKVAHSIYLSIRRFKEKYESVF